MSRKVIIAQFLYEANTFNPRLSGIDNFCQGGTWKVGVDETSRWSHETESALRGSVEHLKQEGGNPVPVFAAICRAPGGRLEASSWRSIKGEILAQIRKELPAEFLLLHLHGAAAAEGVDDPEGELLQVIREGLGFLGRIIVSLDLHANLTPKLLAFSDGFTAYRTMPHEDFLETGIRAAALLMNESALYRSAFKIQALISPLSTSHREGHFKRMLEIASAMENRKGVFDLSLLPVQPWLDVDFLGSAVVVTGSDPLLCRQVAMEVTQRWCEDYAEWSKPLDSFEKIKERLLRGEDSPLFLVDSCDAITGGSTGESSTLLKELLPMCEAFPRPVYLHLVDQKGVEALSRQPGGVLIGNPPVHFDGEVIGETNGFYRVRGPVYRGEEFCMGKTLLLKKGMLRVVLASCPTMGIDPALYESVGLKIAEAGAIQAKSMMGWIAAFSADESAGILFEGNGSTSLNFSKLPFSPARRPMAMRVGQPIFEELNEFTK